MRLVGAAWFGIVCATLAGVAHAADAYRPKPVKRDVLAVVAQVSGDHVVDRVADARVRVFALTRHGRGWRKRLIGHGRTGSRGVALVRLAKRHAPRRLRIEVSGGTLAGKRFRDTMVLQDLDYAAPHAVYVTPVSTLTAADPQAHRVALTERVVAAAETGALADCWAQVAQTTAGFAQFLGFLDVPSRRRARARVRRAAPRSACGPRAPSASGSASSAT